MYALRGAWNSHLAMVKCDAEGEPLPDAPTVDLWKVGLLTYSGFMSALQLFTIYLHT